MVQTQHNNEAQQAKGNFTWNKGRGVHCDLCHETSAIQRNAIIRVFCGINKQTEDIWDLGAKEQ